ncbi:MAG: hypothetical protein KF842_10920 [Caulobacter sp.]|nr:hypothetical protein [Caulobacter sp.]
MIHSRRAAMLGLASLLPAGLAGAARADTRTVEVSKVFPYLDMYLELPPAQRSHFALTYTLRRDGKPATGVSITLLGPGGGRTPLTIGADGRVLRLPTLADYKAKTQVELVKPDGVKVSINLDMVARVAPAATLAAADLTRAINQCDAAIKAKAGLLGFAAPKIRRVMLVGAGSGAAVTAQGVATPLPMMDGSPAFDPGQMASAVTVRLARAPSALLLAGRPK